MERTLFEHLKALAAVYRELTRALQRRVRVVFLTGEHVGLRDVRGATRRFLLLGRANDRLVTRFESPRVLRGWMLVTLHRPASAPTTPSLSRYLSAAAADYNRRNEGEVRNAAFPRCPRRLHWTIEIIRCDDG